MMLANMENIVSFVKIHKKNGIINPPPLLVHPSLLPDEGLCVPYGLNKLQDGGPLGE